MADIYTEQVPFVAEPAPTAEPAAETPKATK